MLEFYCNFADRRIYILSTFKWTQTAYIWPYLKINSLKDETVP